VEYGNYLKKLFFDIRAKWKEHIPANFQISANKIFPNQKIRQLNIEMLGGYYLIKNVEKMEKKIRIALKKSKK